MLTLMVTGRGDIAAPMALNAVQSYPSSRELWRGCSGPLDTPLTGPPPRLHPGPPRPRVSGQPLLEQVCTFTHLRFCDWGTRLFTFIANLMCFCWS